MPPRHLGIFSIPHLPSSEDLPLCEKIHQRCWMKLIQIKRELGKIPVLCRYRLFRSFHLPLIEVSRERIQIHRLLPELTLRSPRRREIYHLG